MFVMDLQLFASKKGVGSSRNGRDSEAKRLGVKRADGQFGIVKFERKGRDKKQVSVYQETQLAVH